MERYQRWKRSGVLFCRSSWRRRVLPTFAGELIVNMAMARRNLLGCSSKCLIRGY